jgi:hypothetical protein
VSLFKTIEKLRERPEHERKSVAFITSLVATALIFALWISTYGITLRTPGATSSSLNQASPFAALKDTAGTIVEQVKNGAVIMKDSKEK